MRAFTIILTLAIGVTTYAGEATKNAIEVGHVRWQRDFDHALMESADNGKPLFVLFQEVPGCSGVKKFGREVLTNPLLVEAIENEFIPVLVYNNRQGGTDELLLKRYREPSWNYQVIRFFNAEGHDVIPRKDRIWTTGGVASRMIEALLAVDRPVPQSLEDLAGAASGY